MAGLLPHVDPEGLMEFSVVYTDRSLNHMSHSFQEVMRDISATLKRVYHAASVAVVPGSGTFGMEAVARQFATNRKCLVIRNGWFSFRWNQIFEAGSIPEAVTVMKARRLGNDSKAPFAPAPIEEVVASIRAERPDLVFATHVETAAGMMLPDSYIRALADTVHEHGGLLVLDCIASGTVWVDMVACGVDILISAPQKGWSSSPCCGLVMLGAAARERIDQTSSTSFACDLRRWLQVMEAYEQGGHAYHATMPTDGLTTFRQNMTELEAFGFARASACQQELGRRVRALLAQRGLQSVAAEGFEAAGVIVCYTDETDVQSGRKFAQLGLQIAAGVPLQCDEPADFRTFRIGLFGLDKLQDIERTIQRLQPVLDGVFPVK